MHAIPDDPWRIKDTADYVCSRRYTILTLQFPDDTLQHVGGVSSALQAECKSRGVAVKVRSCPRPQPTLAGGEQCTGVTY
jgi:hypothetical protein